MVWLKAIISRSILAFSLVRQVTAVNTRQNSTFQNPMLPGWHSDSSCVFVPELDNTTFCTVSTFLNFPGLPIYASRDLVHFEHVSNAFSRPEQLPHHAFMNNNNRGGIWAPTIRYHDGRMYIVVTYVTYSPKEKADNYIFQAEDPFADESWDVALKFTNPTGGNHIDPDIFWEDGTAYVASGWGKIYLSTIDTNTGMSSKRVEIWKGSGRKNPEGPHIYKKDGYYYLLIAEGGVSLDHSATIARATSIWGPYESYSQNPVLTNRGTDELYQTVGHADMFPDADGNWWATALATRSGVSLTNYPMGREAVLTPVTWEEGEWPVFSPVRGVMEGPLPVSDGDIDSPTSHNSILVHEGDKFDFERGFTFPKRMVFFRSKIEDAYSVKSSLLRSRLMLTPSKSNLTGSVSYGSTEQDVTFVGRRQSASLFSFSADVSFHPVADGQESGITVFLNQQQHIDLSLIRESGKVLLPLDATTYGRPNITKPETITRNLPKLWSFCPVRLSVSSPDPDTYEFHASSSCGLGSMLLAAFSTDITSGGFMGKSSTPLKSYLRV